MGLTSTVSHHRRRSSVLVGDRARSHSESGEPYDERTDGFDDEEAESRTNNNGHGEAKPPPIAPDDPVSDQSSTDDSSVELELDDMASDDALNDDEETGLTAKERRQRRRRRRRQRRELDARIANVKISESGRRLADKNVVKKLVFNATLIGLWYIFSLSISIVSIHFSSPIVKETLLTPYLRSIVQQMDVLIRASRFSFPSFHDQLAYGCPVHPGWHHPLFLSVASTAQHDTPRLPDIT